MLLESTLLMFFEKILLQMLIVSFPDKRIIDIGLVALPLITAHMVFLFNLFIMLQKYLKSFVNSHIVLILHIK